MRTSVALVVLLSITSPILAQDMPLSQVLIDGEGWRELTGSERTAALPLLNSGDSAVVKTPLATYSAMREEHGVLVRFAPKSRVDSTLIRATGLSQPSCLILWNDGGTLVVGDADGKYLWTFRVEADGSSGPGDRYYALRVPPGQTASGVTDMALDRQGRLFACTPLGVQVFDPTGRLCGVLLKPERLAPEAVAFGGADGSLLHVRCGDRVFVRKTKTAGR